MSRRKLPRRPNRSIGYALHALLDALQRLLDAIRHVRTGGRSTRRRAVRRAEAPPQKCPTCHQSVKHSPDWRDHLESHL